MYSPLSNRFILGTSPLFIIVAFLFAFAATLQAQTPVKQINAGGPAVAPYAADSGFSAGNSFSSTAAINLTGVTNPAPPAVYQTVRWNSAFNYTLSGLTSGSSYLVRLHFVELSFGAAGQRRFNVAINGASVLTAFDIFAVAGAANKAVVSEFAATANASGQIVVAFSQGGADNPSIAGLEVYPAVTGQTPYGGTNWTINNGAVIQAENYDVGGEGVAYHDTTAGNTGGVYRSDGVDIQACTDTGGGYNVGWTTDGEWLEYTTNTTAGTYSIVLRAASGSSTTRSVRALLDGTVLGSVTIPTTGGWQTWQDFTISGAAITAGTGKVLRLEIVGGDFNLNYVRFATTTATFPLTVANGTGSGNYAAGTVVAIVANAPGAGQVFAGWTGDTAVNFGNAASASTTYKTTSAAQTITATYSTVPTFALTVASGTGSGTYAANTVVAIVANAPGAGQVFAGWTGGTAANFGNATLASTTYKTTSAAQTITATYSTVPTFALTVSGGSGSGNYTVGTIVSITANPPPTGQVFAGWTGGTAANFANAAAASTVYTTTAAAQTITATYKTVPTFALTVSSGSGSGSYPAGTAVSITANPPPAGQIFAGWTGGTVANFANAASATTIYTTTAAAQTLAATFQPAGNFLLQINAGSSTAVSTFVADRYFSAGTAFATGNTVSTTGVVNPAPPAVYQTVRWASSFNYTIPNLTAGSAYTVRLHFAELTWTAAGQRRFNVAINGTSMLSNFDIFATAGSQNKAVVQQFNTTANSSGQIVISFTQGGADNPEVAGIEVLTAVPNSGSAARQKVLNFLTSISGNHCAVGVENKGGGTADSDFMTGMAGNGQRPSFWGADFGFGPAASASSRAAMIQVAKQQWAAGALVALMYHAAPLPWGSNEVACQWNAGPNPLLGSFGTLTAAQWVDLTTPGGTLYNVWIARLDALAPFLQDLKNAGVAPLFRPFHEINASWAWWQSVSGPNGSVKLYQITHDYLTNTKGLDNIVWVWNPQDYATLAQDVNTYSPGTSFFDVAAIDVYNTGYTTGVYNAMVGASGGKPIAIAECQFLPTPALLASQPLWAFAAVWPDFFYAPNQTNNTAQVPALFNDSRVLTLSEMPGW